MNNENKSIHAFDFNLICEYFEGLERQGPGSTEVTVKALSFIDNLNEYSQIADIGCGTGGQTVTLAQHTNGYITGLDLYKGFIDILNDNAARLNLQHKVKGIVGSMDNLPFQEEALDLIWSEGAIYNIGFEKGLKEWRKFVKTGGYVAVTDASWFTTVRPKEIQNFWMALSASAASAASASSATPATPVTAFPLIDTIPNKVKQLQMAGYIPIANFILPENCWTTNFYAPQEKRQKIFLDKYKGDKDAANYVDFERYEMELYYKYKQYYGYVFYIGKKI